MISKRKQYYSKNNFDTLGAILGNSLKNLGLDIQIKQHRVLSEWEKIVGIQIAGVTSPSYFKFKTLFVSVENHVWMQQLTFLEDKMVDKINQYINRKVVEKVYFRVGRTN